MNKDKFNIVDSVKTVDDWNNIFEKLYVYVQSSQVKVHIYGQGDDRNMVIVLIGNAYKRSEICYRYSFDSGYSTASRKESLFELINEIDFNLDHLIGLLVAADYKERNGFYETNLYGFTIQRSNRIAIQTFSPFCLERLKPLKELPKKWTMAHAKRLVVNGQFDDFRCDGKYSSDYARDAEENFSRGPITDPLEFIKDIIERPSGWKCFIDEEGRLNIDCHDFNNNSLIPVLENRIKN